jgi:hypothetical protein
MCVFTGTGQWAIGKTTPQLRLSTAGVSLKLLNRIKWEDGEGEVREFRLINRVRSKWESFGHRLDIQQSKLNDWREECEGNPTLCWMKVMVYWLTEEIQDYPATWDRLYEMLEDMEFTEVAMELKEAVLTIRE